VKLPRDVTGRDLVRVLVRHFGYVQVNQVGSHVILQTSEPKHHRLSVPDHDSLRIGTLNAILRAVAEAKSLRREEIVEKL
jgi:predicted RNA binding protein YcfA (HicA-like mRNA interferase family)